jgi:hypothetical protein
VIFELLCVIAVVLGMILGVLLCIAILLGYRLK